MRWTPNKVTFLRVVVGFAAVTLFGPNPAANLLAVVLTVTAVALDALDGHLARRRNLATPIGANIDILGDRMMENVYFTYFAVAGMVSLWLPVFFFARGAVTDLLRGLAFHGAGRTGWGAASMLQTSWARALVASRWSRAAYATMKCLCFCYLGLELALSRGPVALVGELAGNVHAIIRSGAQILTWSTAAFCFVRGLPVLAEGWRYLVPGSSPSQSHRRFQERGMTAAMNRTAPIAAFFDVDGTLLPLPSLESRFVAALLRNHEIPIFNYGRWLVRSLRLLPQGLAGIPHRNKMLLRGVPCGDSSLVGLGPPAFFPLALRQVAWHARQNHFIALVTGAPAPLAESVAVALVALLALRGVHVKVAVAATKLETSGAHWTGRTVGEIVFAANKARILQRFRASLGLDLASSFAYADSASDRWMLGAVGRPAAVNPSADLRRVAELRGWPVLSWTVGPSDAIPAQRGDLHGPACDRPEWKPFETGPMS